MTAAVVEAVMGPPPVAKGEPQTAVGTSRKYEPPPEKPPEKKRLTKPFESRKNSLRDVPQRKSPEVENKNYFSGQNLEVDDDDDDLAFSEFAGIPHIDGWRIETKQYTRKGGGVSIYYAYRSKKTFVNKYTGKRSTKYRKGGVIRK